MCSLDASIGMRGNNVMSRACYEAVERMTHFLSTKQGLCCSILEDNLSYLIEDSYYVQPFDAVSYCSFLERQLHRNIRTVSAFDAPMQNVFRHVLSVWKSYCNQVQGIWKAWPRGEPLIRVSLVRPEKRIGFYIQNIWMVLIFRGERGYACY